MIEKLRVEARDFEKELALFGVPVEREVAVELLQPARQLVEGFAPRPLLLRRSRREREERDERDEEC